MWTATISQLSDAHGVRTSARGWLDEHDVAAAISADVILMISELVNNAVIHGHAPREISLEVTEASVTIEVADASPTIPVVRPLDPDVLGGNGMRIIDQLATEWGVRPAPGGKVVWARRDRSDLTPSQ